MTKRTAREYQVRSPKDQYEFDRWLNSNAILSSIFVLGLLAMAVVGIGTVVSVESAKGVITVVPTSASGDSLEPTSAVFTVPRMTESKKEKINQ